MGEQTGGAWAAERAVGRAATARGPLSWKVRFQTNGSEVPCMRCLYFACSRTSLVIRECANKNSFVSNGCSYFQNTFVFKLWTRVQTLMMHSLLHMNHNIYLGNLSG